MLRQLHALVVDDEPQCRDFLCRQIERICPSLNVLQTATSAREAERLILELAPDVVFMDIHMPHRSGIELTNSLAHRDFFLVYTTAYHEYAVDALRQKAFEQRARKRIEKKVRTGKVRRALNRAADPEAGARRDAERKERMRMAKSSPITA